jgi:hypothetical protein
MVAAVAIGTSVMAAVAVDRDETGERKAETGERGRHPADGSTDIIGKMPMQLDVASPDAAQRAAVTRMSQHAACVGTAR